MADFNFFSQLQGPVVPISLFGDAARSGTQVGAATPTGLTAAIQGGIKGFQQGQEIVQNNQAIAINQHRIDQQPTEDAIQQERLEAAQQANEIQALQVEVAKKTQKLRLDTAEQELVNKNAELTKATQTFDNKKLIAEKLASNDPGAKRSVLDNPDLLGTILEDSKYANSVFGQLSTVMSEDEKKQAFDQVDFIKSRERNAIMESLESRRRQDLLEGAGKDEQYLQAESSLGWFMSQKGLDFMGLLKGVTTEPAGPGQDRWNVKFKGEDVLDFQLSGKDNGIFSRTKKRYQDAGFLKTEPAETPAPSAETPAPEKQPFLSRLFGGSSTPVAPQNLPGPQASAAPTPAGEGVAVDQNAIVQQRYKKLLSEAQNDPDLMTRLVAKGLAQKTPAPTAAPTAPPMVTPTESRPSLSLVQPSNDVPPAPPEIQSQEAGLKQDVGFVYKSLPEEVKRSVDKGVVTRVIGEPLLRNLPSIYKAVAAVESGGRREAKNQGSTAEGLFQMTAPAAKDMQKELGSLRKHIPADNVKLGVGYLNRLLKEYNGEKVPALFAYIGGPGLIRDAVEMTNSTDYEDIVNALHYMKDKGRYKNVLKRIDEIVKYPLKVLAYEEAFEAFSYA